MFGRSLRRDFLHPGAQHLQHASLRLPDLDAPRGHQRRQLVLLRHVRHGVAASRHRVRHHGEGAEGLCWGEVLFSSSQILAVFKRAVRLCACCSHHESVCMWSVLVQLPGGAAEPSFLGTVQLPPPPANGQLNWPTEPWSEQLACRIPRAFKAIAFLFVFIDKDNACSLSLGVQGVERQKCRVCLDVVTALKAVSDKLGI